MIQYSKSLNPGLGQAQRRGKKRCPTGVIGKPSKIIGKTNDYSKWQEKDRCEPNGN